MSVVVWGMENSDGGELEVTRINNDTWTFRVDDSIEGCQIDLSWNDLYGLYATIKNELRIVSD